MRGKSDLELIKIISIDRRGYELLAIEAARNELESRGLSESIIQKTIQSFDDSKERENYVDDSVVKIEKRLANFLIDLVIIYAVQIIVVTASYYMWGFLGLIDMNQENPLGGIGVLGNIAIYFAYYILLEVNFGQTVGKMLTKSIVVDKTGEKVSWGEITIRTLCRFIPFEWISYLGNPIGLHDSLSKTRVISKHTFNELNNGTKRF